MATAATEILRVRVAAMWQISRPAATTSTTIAAIAIVLGCLASEGYRSDERNGQRRQRPEAPGSRAEAAGVYERQALST